VSARRAQAAAAVVSDLITWKAAVLGRGLATALLEGARPSGFFTAGLRSYRRDPLRLGERGRQVVLRQPSGIALLSFREAANPRTIYLKSDNR